MSSHEKSARSIEEIARAARGASRALASLGSGVKNRVLHGLADLLEDREPEVLGANAEDMGAAMAADMPTAKLRRLQLTREGMAQMRDGLRQIAALPDPVGEVTRASVQASGLRVERVRCPIGVIAMIYEARPGVTIDAFALCFKAGNACLLKGGREARHSNTILASLAKEALAASGAPEDAMEAVSTSDRDELARMLTLEQDIDLVIPRGGASLIRFVHEHSLIPTVQHYHGVCHVFVDGAADLEMALEIIATGKAGAPAACNATECVLVDGSVAESFLPMLVSRAEREGIELRLDERAGAVAGGSPAVHAAVAGDFGREFLDMTLAVRVVDGLDAAVAHVHRFGSAHTDAIVTADAGAAEEWCRRVQSSCVLVNASTRFNDGYQLGLGAEIGISTQRVHAFGPMGLEELTVQRFVVRGDGQTR